MFVCVRNGILNNMPIQGSGVGEKRVESEWDCCRTEGKAGGECLVSMLGGSLGHRGRGMGEVLGWRAEAGAWFPVPQIPSSCLWSRYTKPPLKVSERGGRMKRSH